MLALSQYTKISRSFIYHNNLNYREINLSPFFLPANRISYRQLHGAISGTVLEAEINGLQFSTTLLVLVIFFNNHDVLHQKLTKIGASDYHNESVKIV